ncbi:hypothetical protein JT358_14165 [Micrococcales bacterium 31B]|nr:hypothetical protein [Micrococcales bacterium 31B]
MSVDVTSVDLGIATELAEIDVMSRVNSSWGSNGSALAVVVEVPTARETVAVVVVVAAFVTPV